MTKGRVRELKEFAEEDSCATEISSPTAKWAKYATPTIVDGSVTAFGSEQRSFHEGEGLVTLPKPMYVMVYAKIVAHASLVAFPVVIFMAIYFSPVIVSDEFAHGQTTELLYITMRGFFNDTCFYMFASIYGVRIFGWDLYRRVLVKCLLPCFIIGTGMRVYMGSGFAVTGVNIIAVSSSLFIIKKAEFIDLKDEVSISIMERKNDISWPLVKIIFITGSAYSFVQLMFVFYLKFGFFGKMCIRFVFVPLISAVSATMHVSCIMKVQPKHMEACVPVLWLTTGYVKISERLFSNSVVDEDNYIWFAVMTFVGCLFEIAVHISYVERVEWSQKLLRWFATRRKSLEKSKIVRRISIAVTKAEGNAINREKIEQIDFLDQIRRSVLVDDVAVEIKMILTVTFLLFFVDGVETHETFQTTTKIQSCIVQLVIQLFFESICDLFTIYYSHRRQKFLLNPHDIQLIDPWMDMKIIFLFYQTFQIIAWIIEI